LPLLLPLPLLLLLLLLFSLFLLFLLMLKRKPEQTLDHICLKSQRSRERNNGEQRQRESAKGGEQPNLVSHRLQGNVNTASVQSHLQWLFESPGRECRPSRPPH